MTLFILTSAVTYGIYPFVTDAPPLSPPALSGPVLALCLRFILFIEDLIRMLEEVSGDTLAPHLRRASGLDAMLAELRAVADRLADPDFQPDEYDPDSDYIWVRVTPNFFEDWRATSNLPRLRRAGAHLYARALTNTRTTAENFENFAWGRTPSYVQFVTNT
jgi:hypothetical protein